MLSEPIPIPHTLNAPRVPDAQTPSFPEANARNEATVPDTVCRELLAIHSLWACRMALATVVRACTTPTLALQAEIVRLDMWPEARVRGSTQLHKPTSTP